MIRPFSIAEGALCKTENAVAVETDHPRRRLVSFFAVASARFSSSAGQFASQPSGGPVPTPSAVTQPVRPPASSEVNEMKSPFLFREAKLPKGFPPPGPIGQVIVKEYPEARAAVVQSAALGKAADEGRMFQPLFNHIKSHEIAMSRTRGDHLDAVVREGRRRRAGLHGFLLR